MRCLHKLRLVLALVVSIASSAYAQNPPTDVSGDRIMLLMDKKVQKELKLTKEQVDKIDKAFEQLAPEMADVYIKIKARVPTGEESANLVKKMNAIMDKVVASTLKPEQVKRLTQIEFQRAGFAVFNRQDVQKQLRLTAEQQKEVKTISDSLHKEWGKVWDEARASLKFDEAIKKIDELEKNGTQKVIALLNEGQKKTWEDLIGQPFDRKGEKPPDKPQGPR